MNISQKKNFLAHTRTPPEESRTARNTVVNKPKKRLFAGAKNNIKYNTEINTKSKGKFELLCEKKTEVKIKRSGNLLKKSRTQYF